MAGIEMATATMRALTSFMAAAGTLKRRFGDAAGDIEAAAAANLGLLDSIGGSL